MKTRFTLPLVTLTLLVSINAHAEVTLDGSLGHAGALPGPDYQIGADVGQQHGGNLFHSFQDFNLQSHESATFSGPVNVQNIISRVTGGNPSSIDGTLRSTIPNADLYFLNPYGILFGPNAKLDLQGGFHASTADYLRLGENAKFHVNLFKNSVLSVASPTAFGFLSDSPKSIATQDSKLSVPYSKSLSLIGGDLELNGKLVFNELGEQQFRIYADPLLFLNFLIPIYTNQIIAESGRINLVSVASPGEVSLRESDIELSNNMQGGQMTIHNTDINVNGEGGGSIFIRGGQFQLVNSHLESQTWGNQDGDLIDVQVNNFIMQGGGNYSSITTDTLGAGQSSAINIRAKQMTASDGVLIGGSTHGYGNPATINVKVEGALTFLGKVIPELGFASAIQNSIMAVNPDIDRNNPSSISVEAGQLTLTDSAQIISITLGAKDSAPINVKVHDSLKISGVKFLNEYTSSVSGIMTISFTGSSVITFYGGVHRSEGGNSGNIKIEAGQIEVKDGAMISTDSYVGDAGNLEINADQLTIEEDGFVNAVTEGTGNGGTIVIHVNDTLTISDLNISNPFEDMYSTISTWSASTEDHAGIAGRIVIYADKIKLNGLGAILTTSQNAKGGNIDLTVPNLLYLQGGSIETSVHGGTGDGGNINIDNPQFVVLNKGQIKAQADAGHGGNIHIVAQQFLNTPDSLISASSRVGLDGQVVIDSPMEKISGSLLALGTTFTELSNLLPRPCSALSFEEFIHRSSFLVKPLVGSSPRPDDLKPSSLLLPITASPNFTKATGSKAKKAKLSQRLAWLTGCHR